jgi:glycosyltransferase involved in cell wall biosynthesis
VAVTLEQLWHAVPGGTATSILRTLEAMADVPGVEPVGVAAMHRASPRPPFQPPVGVRHLPLPRLALYEAWHRLRRPAVQLVTGRVDVVHATTFAIPPKRSPLVVTVHDLAFLRTPEHFSRRGNAFFRCGLELVQRDADLVLVPSQATWDDCVHAGVPAQRLRLVPWGVTALDVTADDVARVRRQVGVSRPYVMWCGTLEPRKNVRTLLEAYQLLLGSSDVDLVMVGPQGWGDAGTEALERLPPGRVHTTGFVSDTDLHALYAGARAFCYPSMWEGFGMPVLEAMAHGVPVVTSTGTPMAELVGDAGLAVDPRDVEAVAGALRRVMGEGRNGYAERSLSRAATFTWRRAAELTGAAYRELTSGS